MAASSILFRGGSMKRGFVCGLAVAALAWSAAAQAQTKFSITADCAKDDMNYAVPVNDQPGHVFALGQGKCALKGDQMAGLSFKEQQTTVMADSKGAKSSDRG